MNKICIRCGKKWAAIYTKDQDGLDTHGICVPCLIETLIPIFRKRQAKEGNPDCFGKSTGYCDRRECLYFDLCVKRVLPGSEPGVHSPPP